MSIDRSMSIDARVERVERVDVDIDRCYGN